MTDKKIRPALDPPPARKRVLLTLAWYSVAIHRGITHYAHNAKWVLSGGFVRHGWAPETWRGDGIITVLGVHPDLDARVLQFAGPKVTVGYGQAKGVPNVMADSAAIGRMAAEHFILRGFKHFAYYEPYQGAAENDRYAGFEATLAARGHTARHLGLPRPTARDRHLPAADTHEHLGRQLARLPKPVAVLAEYDDHAIDVIDAALLAGLRVPEQVAVLGVDNDDLRCPFAPVPLSSIDNDEERIGYEAARVLDDLMHDRPAPPGPVRIPPRRVVVRQSTNILAIPHPHVATALRLIWERYNEPIDAVRVAAEVPLSYPQLHLSFVKHVGHSMADEIERLRLEHAQQLLVTTDAKLSDVAHKSGFGTADRMGRVFVRRLAQSPSDYRSAMAGASSKPPAPPARTAKPAAFPRAPRP